MSYPPEKPTSAAKSPLQILLLEDSLSDADLILATLAREGLDCNVVRIETRADLLHAIEEKTFDVILSDCGLPCFDGFSALKIPLEKLPGVPFIYVSGTIGEEQAVEALRSGATDCVFKMRLSHLGPVVRRAVAEASERAARQEAERLLAENEILLRSFFDSPGAMRGVVEVMNNNIVHIFDNAQSSAFFGHESVENRFASERDTLDLWIDHFEKCQKLLQPVRFEYRHKNGGSEIWLSATVSSAGMETSPRPRFAYDVVDITEQKRSQRQIQSVADITDQKREEQQSRNVTRLEDVAAESEAANRAKSTFLSTMSHEIRTPLNAILGYSQLMLRDPDLGEDAKAHLKIINRSGEHLLSLINDVLDMSKIEAGRTEINPTTFSLSGLLEDLTNMFRLRAEAKALRFEMSTQGESVPYIQADEGKIRQALINLLGNAIKFTEHGEIKLRVRVDQRQNDQLWFSAGVEDTGSGVSDEEQKKLFQPFTQTKGALNTQQGTGLGLAISRQHARLMGGDITVSSTPSGGSRFQFEVPIARGDSGVVVKRGIRSRVIRLRPGQEAPRILVVDDHIENQHWLTMLLSSIGFCARGANDGEAAIRLWKEWSPRLILMDIHMPVMNGLEATRRIKADPQGKETFIITLTASALDEDRRTASQSGADDFLAKPCREDEMLEKIRALLNVVYDYEETNGNDNKPIAGRPAWSAERLGQLPLELIEEIRNATVSGNKTLLDMLILGVAETGDAGSAHALGELADKYEYDMLMELLEKACRR